MAGSRRSLLRRAVLRRAVSVRRRPAGVTAVPETVLPAGPRVLALDAVLRGLAELRLTLETDLSLAAAAVEVAAPALAREIIAGDQDELRAFRGRALEQLSGLAGAVPGQVPGHRRPDDLLSAAVPARRAGVSYLLDGT